MEENSKKSIKDLNLIDSFLFSCSTEDNQDAEFISRVIIERATGRAMDRVVVEVEKPIKSLNVDERGIRLDICVSEKEGDRVARVYDIEPNKYKSKELFHRSRYYQSIIDTKKLKSKEKFDMLPDFMSIWILTYDPFGENRMVYKVKNTVEDAPELVYNDGVMKLFLYTGGEKSGSKELKDLLNYFVNTCEENAVDDDLRRLQSIVDKVKGNKEVGERFMRFESDWDCERREIRQQSHKEGRVEGLRDGEIKGIINSYRKFNATEEQIISTLMEECNLTEDEAREKLAGN